jgi:hypothetical protein
LQHYQRGKKMRGRRREGHGGVLVEGQAWITDMLREGHAGHLVKLLATELSR